MCIVRRMAQPIKRSDGTVRENRFVIRLAHDERQVIERAAARQNLTASEYARNETLKAAGMKPK